MSNRRIPIVRAAASAVAATLFTASFASAAPVVDGTLDPIYGAPVAVQTVNTGFGDNSSELNAMYARIDGGKLYVMLTGNLEANFNKLIVFFDTRAGGQNVMRGDNPVVDFDQLNTRYVGMTFDTGFEPDYTLFWSGDATNMFLNFSELNTNGGGLGGFLGSVATPGLVRIGSGTVGGGNLPVVEFGYNDSNLAGVTGDAPNAADPVAAAAVTTGSEFSIELPQIGALGDLKIFVGINGAAHDYWSNQFAPGLQAPQGNLGSDGFGNFIPPGSVSLVNFNNFAGDQFLTINYAAPSFEWDNAGNGNWSTASNWTSDTVPNAIDAIATLGTVAGSAPRTVTLDIPVRLQRLVFDGGQYTVDGSSTLTIAGNPAAPSVLVNAGVHSITAPLVLGQTTQFNIAASSSLDIGNVTATDRALVKTGPGRVNFNNIRAESLNIVEGTVGILTNGGPSGTGLVNTLIIAGGSSPTATLDLTNNGMAVNYTPPPPPDPEGGNNSPYAEIRDQIISGYAGGSWTGPGITSSTAAANPTTHGVGYAESSDVLGPTGGTFGGVTVDESAVLFRYTRLGDANLDGITNIGDFSRLGANFNQPGDWAQGDFNYDGQVGIADFSLLGANFNLSAEAARPGAVPEPGVLSVLGLAAAGLLRRRRD